MSPLLEDYARHVIDDRLSQAQRDALAAEAMRRGQPAAGAAYPFAATARVRLADGLRSLACRLDPGPCGEPALLIARSR
jgi:hypothetical protein